MSFRGCLTVYGNGSQDDSYMYIAIPPTIGGKVLTMKTALVIVVLLLIAAATTAQDVQYFPSLTFSDNPRQNDSIVQRYTEHLKALQEPSLLQHATTAKQEYRLLWLRTFHNPVAIRLDMNPDGTALVTVKVTNGSGGYESGTLTKNAVRRLSKRETERFLARVQKLEYWNLPTREPRSKSNVIVVDGSKWVLEAINDGKYKVVDRGSLEKENGAVHKLGTMMLFDLAKLKRQDVAQDSWR